MGQLRMLLQPLRTLWLMPQTSLSIPQYEPHLDVQIQWLIFIFLGFSKSGPWHSTSARNFSRYLFLGKAFELYRKTSTTESGAGSGLLAVYCINCGVTGTVHLYGQASFDVASLSVTSGGLGLDGNIAAGLTLGVVSQSGYTGTFEKDIAEVGLPGFSVPGVITIGPVLQLKAETTLEVAAKGSIRAGITATLNSFQAVLDLVDTSGSSSSGFTPTFSTEFAALGAVSASVSLGLPVSLGIGLVIPIIQFEKTLSLIENPYLQASAEAVIAGTPSQGLDLASCPKGVAYQLALHNDITLDFFGVQSIDLFNYQAPPLAQGCFSVGSSTTAQTMSRRLLGPRQASFPSGTGSTDDT